MTGTSFVLRGLWFFRLSYLAVLAAASLGAMVWLGALMAGDSVKESLRNITHARLGKVNAALSGGDRFFRCALADDLTTTEVNAAPVLCLKAVVTVQTTGQAVGAVQVLGVDQRFGTLGPGNEKGAPPEDDEFFVNDHLARQLNLKPEQPLVLRFEKPSAISQDAPLAGKPADWVALRGRVRQICGDAQFGSFNLESTQLPLPTVMVPIGRLQKLLELDAKANLMLIHNTREHDHDALLRSLTRHCTLADYGITVENVPLAKAVEIRSARVFFNRQVAAVIRNTFPAAQPVITYMANSLAANGRNTPYSMITAVDAEAAPFLTNMTHGVVLNDWAADDLNAKTGDQVRIDYYAMENGNRLVERSVHLPVAGVVPLIGLAADRRWMPDFPGVATAEHAGDWDAGVPIDLKRIRAKDEAYWDAHRGTPKLFMPLEQGRALFGNRWGEFTALRIPSDAATPSEITGRLLSALTPAVAGLTLRDVASQGAAAAASPVDFAGLLLGMSLFLMAAAASLTAMLFRFHIDQRNRESGLLAVLGIPARKVLRWHLTEGLCVVLIGCALGAVLAAAYTQLLLARLETIWSTAGGRPMFRFHVEPATVLIGMASFTSLMMVVIWRVTSSQARASANLRLEAGTEEIVRSPAQPVPWWAAGFATAALVALGATSLLGRQGAFFLAGCALLLAGLALYRWVLRRRAAAADHELTPKRLARLNCARRATRSLVVAGTLASGVFLVVAVAAFRKHGGDEWRARASGAGGFAFWVETTRALNRDHGGGTPNDLLESSDLRPSFGHILPLRIGPGDDASCFNLNTVARPRLLAADAAAIARLGAFPVKQAIQGARKSWSILSEGDVTRAFVDETTMLWVLKKKVGDRILYQDEWGREFPIEIAGTLDGTVFQGAFVVDEARFLTHYPSAHGPRLFLMDCDGQLEVRQEALQKALADHGAVVTTTRERLAAFHGVENAYISIFQLLGGLGVIVGSAGLGLVTARNLIERRHEFSILHTLGVPEETTRRVVLLEAGQLIRWGLGIGTLAATLSILPSLASGTGLTQLASIGLLLILSASTARLASWLGLRSSSLPSRSIFDR